MQAQNSQCTPVCRNRVAMLQIQPEEMASYIDPALFSGVAYYVVKSDFLTISSPKNQGSCNIVWDILWHLGTMICKQNSWSKHFYERMFIGRYDGPQGPFKSGVPSDFDQGKIWLNDDLPTWNKVIICWGFPLLTITILPERYCMEVVFGIRQALALVLWDCMQTSRPNSRHWFESESNIGHCSEIPRV